MSKTINLSLSILSSIVLCFVSSHSVLAQSSQSTNYRVDEAGFATGSEIDATSTSFRSRVSAGDLGVGISESGNFITYGGFISPDDEYVELVVPVQTVDLGTLTPGVPATGTATFTARSYLNHDYIIVSSREAPSITGYTINTIGTAAPIDTAQEQFGMNLVANTSPVNFGADPSRQPVDDGTFAFGQAASGYNTANNYQYNAGDIIAESTARGYGETDYTISYIMNITTITPAGSYRMEQDLVITATF